MLDDRSYMKSSPLDRRPVTITLLIVLIAIYVIQSCLQLYGGYPLNELFGLSLHGIKEYHLWQLVTFQFLHQVPMPWHLLFNCLGLYFFGRAVEDALGGWGFLRLYFASGLFGGVVQLLATWLPHHSDIPVVGASAGVMGL